MRLIDKDELKKELVNYYSYDWGLADELGEKIDQAPTIDQWHYPSKGEYPTEKELVLMKVPGCYVIGWYYKKNWFMDDGELTVLPYDASHWQYIIPPKEEA